MAQYVQDEPMPKILDMVDVDSDKFAQYAAHSGAPKSWVWGLEARRLQHYETQVARLFTTTLLCARTDGELLRSRVPGAPVMIVAHPLGLDFLDTGNDELPAEIAALQPYVVFNGQMDYLPNVDAVTYFSRDVLPLVRQRFPSVKFVIAGRNPASAVKKLAKDSAVIVTGTVPDMRPYLRGASAAVLPLRLGRGIANKVVEALAIGTPVVTTSKIVSSLPSAISVLARVADSAEEITSATGELLLHPDPDFSSRSREVIRRYLSDDFDGLLCKVVEEALPAPDGRTSLAGVPTS
jgi:glycosyltransferase involved in cell wall biosynthesis